MSETRFEELKRYVRFDEEDARALAALRPFAAPHRVRIAREFYERIREHEEAHAVFTDGMPLLAVADTKQPEEPSVAPGAPPREAIAGHAREAFRNARLARA